MKNLRFISGLVLGLVSGVLLVIGLRCTTGPDIENQIKPDSIVMMKGIDGHFSCGAYKMTIDNIEYIVVRDELKGGVAVIKHQQ